MTSRAARAYLMTEAGSGVLVLAAAGAALLWSNAPGPAGYERFWTTSLSIQVGTLRIDETFRHWVNEGLMSLFFLVIGLEIARELSVGEYRDRRALAAPALAALGGIVVPALVYLAIVGVDSEAALGWGVVISTDTAFALSVLALVGPRCPNRLRVFLLALAILDDIAAIGVIAVVYTDDVAVGAAAAAVALLVVVVVVRRAGVTHPAPFVLLGAGLWLAAHTSGIHPTIAGVSLGLLFAAYPPVEREVRRAAMLSRAFVDAPSPTSARAVRRSMSGALSANDRLTLSLHPLVSFGVVPLFALANAGVVLNRETLAAAGTSRLAWAVALGLVVGKLLGVIGGTWLALRLPTSTFVGGVRWGQMTGIATVAGHRVHDFAVHRRAGVPGRCRAGASQDRRARGVFGGRGSGPPGVPAVGEPRRALPLRSAGHVPSGSE
jgi:Na+/H+ antiporter NhaA